MGSVVQSNTVSSVVSSGADDVRDVLVIPIIWHFVISSRMKATAAKTPWRDKTLSYRHRQAPATTVLVKLVASASPVMASCRCQDGQ